MCNTVEEGWRPCPESLCERDDHDHSKGAEIRDNECPNGPDEDGNWPCDPKGYFGVAECQTCGRVGSWPVRPLSRITKCPGCGRIERGRVCVCGVARSHRV